MAKTRKCLICGEHALYKSEFETKNHLYDCPTCGRYAITDKFYNKFAEDRAVNRSWIDSVRVKIVDNIKSDNENGNRYVLHASLIGEHL